jgi:uncharacterized protein YeaO (DUF488 family)
MAIRIVRLGSPRGDNEGIRIGTVRRPPRGVRKQDYARLDYYDTWLPQLAPSAPLVSMAQDRTGDPGTWKRFETRYLRELSTPDNQRLLDLLAALSRESDFSVGCYCEDESACHRRYLKQALSARGGGHRFSHAPLPRGIPHAPGL